jgi:DNA repair protein RadA/Sms
MYTCNDCAQTFTQWAGQCTSCMAWNSLAETPKTKKDKRALNYHGYAATRSKVTPIASISFEETLKISTDSKELDRVLGGGLVSGSVILIGGDPGIGKSTLLLQTLAALSQKQKVLYVTGEESLQQVALRARRLQLTPNNLLLLSETHVETIISTAGKKSPKVLVIDSIQTVFTDSLSAAPGGVGQIRESAQQLVRFAKSANISLFVVGHVTKEGTLAGPRVLEHMVDTVLYFEGEPDSRFRLIRAIKNRFGAVNEIGLFAMTDKGLKDVSNPSAIFLSNNTNQLPGSVVMVTKEGTRPLLIEVQALVDEPYGQARRIAVGLDSNRLTMLLAVLHRHGGQACSDQNVFINVVGGVKVNETGIDLALLMALLSSHKNIAIPGDLIVFGEVGLAGEIRPVSSGQERLAEAKKHGFKTAVIPKANVPKKDIGLTIHAISEVQELVTLINDL